MPSAQADRLVRMIINAEMRNEEEYVDSAVRWLLEGFLGAAPDIKELLDAEGAQGLAHVLPSVRCVVSVGRFRGGQLSRESFAYRDGLLLDIADSLLVPPDILKLRVDDYAASESSRADGHLPRFLEAEVRTYPEAPGWVQFGMLVYERDFGGAEFQARLMAFYSEFCDSIDPSYGEIGLRTVDGSETSLEDALGLSPVWERINLSRIELRGYGWTTVVPQELVDRLGPVGDGSTVRQLSDGAQLIRACENYTGFDRVALERVFTAVARILPAGLPVVGPLHPSLLPHCLVAADAAQV